MSDQKDPTQEIGERISYSPVQPDDSGTQILLKAVESRPWVSLTLYFAASCGATIGIALEAMTQQRWTDMFWVAKIGFFATLIGNVAITMKAALSSSTRKK